VSRSATNGYLSLHGLAANYCRRFCGLKLWMLEILDIWQSKRKCGRRGRTRGFIFSHEMKVTEREQPSILTSDVVADAVNAASPHAGRFTYSDRSKISAEMAALKAASSSLLQTSSATYHIQHDIEPSLCIAVIGATGELARRKIFPALFALYYSGFLSENVGIFGYSRENPTDEDLCSIMASTLTCHVDHRENCGDKMDAFLNRTF
ncbi:Glucose-6-phosphate dehydrogenase, NAD-binding, partial [Dillenia turbinata]